MRVRGRRMCLAGALALASALGACSSSGEPAPDGEGVVIDAASDPATEPTNTDRSEGSETSRNEAIDEVLTPSSEAEGASEAPGETAPTSEPTATAAPSDPEQDPPPATGPVPGEGPGVTDEELVLGFQVTVDVQAGFAAVGATGEAPDDELIVETLVDWVNDNGGIAGRQVRAVVHGTSVTTGTFASQAQAACSTFTEDNEVFAVSSGPVTVGDFLLACLAQKSTPLLGGNYWVFDEPYYDEYPGLLYRPGRMRPERWSRAYVDGLRREGFFGTADAPNRVGLLRFDAPVFTRISDGMIKPRIAELGLAPPVEITIGTPDSVAGFGGMAAELQNAIVRLRSEGVTHVMFLENGAVMTFFFTQEAENQGYRPIYGLGSSSTPSTIADQAPGGQLDGAIAIGWQPPIELYYPEHPGGNANFDTCRRIMDEAGVTQSHKRRGYYTQSRCDGVMFLKAALDRAQEVSVTGLRAATAQLGSAYRSPFAWATHFEPGRHDGAQGAAPMRFLTDCSCFQYTGDPVPTP